VNVFFFHSSWATILLLPFMAACGPTKGDGSSSPQEDEKKMMVRTLVNPPRDECKQGFTISLTFGGRMQDAEGHFIDDEGLLTVFRPDNTKEPRYVYLRVIDEEKTSVSTLTRAVSTLKAAADPARETIIVLRLSSERK
jgi:hypothetical protein